MIGIFKSAAVGVFTFVLEWVTAWMLLLAFSLANEVWGAPGNRALREVVAYAGLISIVGASLLVLVKTPFALGHRFRERVDRACCRRDLKRVNGALAVAGYLDQQRLHRRSVGALQLDTHVQPVSVVVDGCVSGIDFPLGGGPYWTGISGAHSLRALHPRIPQIRDQLQQLPVRVRVRRRHHPRHHLSERRLSPTATLRVPHPLRTHSRGG